MIEKFVGLSSADGRKIREMWNWFISSERRRPRNFENRKALTGSGKCTLRRFLISRPVLAIPNGGTFEVNLKYRSDENTEEIATIDCKWDQIADREVPDDPGEDDPGPGLQQLINNAAEEISGYIVEEGPLNQSALMVTGGNGSIIAWGFGTNDMVSAQAYWELR